MMTVFIFGWTSALRLLCSSKKSKKTGPYLCSCIIFSLSVSVNVTSFQNIDLLVFSWGTHDHYKQEASPTIIIEETVPPKFGLHMGLHECVFLQFSNVQKIHIRLQHGINLWGVLSFSVREWNGSALSWWHLLLLCLELLNLSSGWALVKSAPVLS